MKDLLLVNLKERRNTMKRIETCACDKEVEDLLNSRKVEWLKDVTVRIN